MSPLGKNIPGEQVTGKPASELLYQFDPAPQLLKNARFSSGQTPLKDTQVKGAIAQAEAELAQSRRLLIRKSGTEALVRLMAEHKDATLIERVVESVVDRIVVSVAREEHV